jgi:hypothetical protein
MPRVRVVYPSQNGEVVIGTAYESTLYPSMGNQDLLVADDAGRDDDGLILGPLGLKARVTRVPQGYAQAARNRASDSDNLGALGLGDTWWPRGSGRQADWRGPRESAPKRWPGRRKPVCSGRCAEGDS